MTLIRPPQHHILSLLERSEILSTLGKPELADLAERVHYTRYAPNDLIFTKGSEGNSMLMVESGRVKIVSVSPVSGAELILNLIGPGQIFGELSLLDGKPRSADAIAATETAVLRLDRRYFLGALRRHARVAEPMMRILCDRIRQTTMFVEDAVLLDAPRRLYHRLILLADRFGTPNGSGQGVRIEHGLSQRELGESVGLTRVSINRQLAAWRQRGLIEDGRGYTVIHDLEALATEVLDNG